MRLENRLDIGRRGGDDLEHVGAPGLVGQRLGEIARLRLHLVEQPSVLDRDHRLVGKGAKQLDVMIGEHARLAPRADDETDECALVHQRRVGRAAPTAGTGEFPDLPVGCFGVYDLRRLAVLDQTDDGRHLASMPWERCLEHFVGFRVGRGEGHQVIDVVDDAMDGSGKPADQTFGAVGDGVEHRLHV